MGKAFDLDFMISAIPEFLYYLPVTLGIAFAAGILALCIGFTVALIRYFYVPVLKKICIVEVSIARGTPCMEQMLLTYNGIPIFLKSLNAYLGTNISVNGIPATVFAITALSLNIGAFMSETLRSSLLSVDKGQFEACYSVNMTTFQALRRIVIPQAFTVAIPPLGNTFISLVKDTSLIFSISVVEMMAVAKIVGGRSFRFFEVYIVVALIYWLVCILLERVVVIAEKRFRKYQAGTCND